MFTKLFFDIVNKHFQRIKTLEDLNQWTDQRKQQTQKASGKNVFGNVHPTVVNTVHTNHAEQETEHTGALHQANVSKTFAQASDLQQRTLLIFVMGIVVVQFPHYIGDGQKPVGIGQQQEADGRE